METPTSDLGSNDDLTPSDISDPPTPPEPFHAKFKVKVTDPVKDGEIVTYTLNSTETLTEREYCVSRDYEDFEYLHHCLCSSPNSNGIILPPLPPKPAVEAKDARSLSKKQLGKGSKVLIADRYNRDCRSLEKYLRQVLSHRVLGVAACLYTFLTQQQVPERVQVKKSFFGKLSTVVDEARKAHHRDVDEYFQRERDWSQEHAKNTKHLCDSFNKVIYAEHRLAGAFAHLSTALLLGGGVEDEFIAQTNRLLVKFSESLEDAKHGCDVDVANDENTLGFHLDLATRYAESLKDMLFHRTCLMVDYEEANRVLDKAKINKHSEAEEHQLAAERAFDECSDVARTEIQRYKQQRVVAFQESLVLYSEAKVKTARDTYALLARSMSYFKQLDI